MEKLNVITKTKIDLIATVLSIEVGKKYYFNINDFVLESVRNAVTNLQRTGKGTWRVSKVNTMEYTIERIK